MASFNKTILLGNLTRDVEMKYTDGGLAVAEFGLAVNTKRKETEEVLFIDVTFFGKAGETINQYMSKGNPLLVEGRLKLDRWETKDGQKRSKIHLIGDGFQFVGGKGDRPSDASQEEDINQDEIPF